MSLIVFLGESGSGKTATINGLIDLHPDSYKKVITCTSRQMRAGEADGVDYHFCQSKYFTDNFDLVLLKRVANGDCYATRKADLHSESHILLLSLRPIGLIKLVQRGFKDITVINISISETLKIWRMHHRGDSEELISARLKSDRIDRREDHLHGLSVIHIDAADPITTNLQLILRSTHV